jgi:hypothetical protein
MKAYFFAACAFHKWIRHQCVSSCQGRQKLPSKFSASFIHNLNANLKYKKLNEEEKLEETVKLYEKFQAADFIDLGRGWGYNLLSEDDPIWKERDFEKMILKYIPHSGTVRQIQVLTVHCIFLYLY